MRTPLFTALAALTLASPAAQAGQACADRDQVVSTLASRYGEQRQSVGLGENNTLVELFASPETGTWTITVTTPGGLTCMVATGASWQAVADSPRPQEQDA